MTIGSLLLEPQVLGRLQTQDQRQSVVDDLLAVFNQALASPENVASIAPGFQRAFAGMADGLRSRIEPNLTRTLGELQTLVSGAVGDFEAIARRVNALESLSDGFELVSSLLSGASALLQSISEPTLRAVSRKIHGLLSDTLGLDQAFMRDELRKVFRSLRAELLGGAAAVSARIASLHYALAAVLGRAEAQLFPLLPSFDFNPDRLAQQAMQLLEHSGFLDVQAKLACVLDKLRAALAAGGGIAALAGVSPFGSGSVGAAAPRPPQSGDTYLWYASWLYRSRRRSVTQISGWGGQLFPGLPNDEVWHSQDKKQLILRRVWAADDVLHAADAPFEWYDAPLFNTANGAEVFSFRASAQAMEILTKVLEATAELAKGIVHIVFMATGKREHGTNIPLWLWNWTNSVFAFVSLGADNAPLAALAANAAGQPAFFEWLFAWVPALSVMIGSIEGTYSEAAADSKFLYWATLSASHTLSSVRLSTRTRIAKDVILEIVTLINNKSHGTPTEGRPRNFEYSDGMIEAWGYLSDFILTKFVIRREDYAPIWQANAMYALYTFVAAPVAGVLAATVGTLTGWTFAVTYDWGQLGRNIGWNALKSFVLCGVGLTQYLGMEGDTDGGKYNPRFQPDGTDHNPPRLPFVGYPEPATSPYKLPWESGKTRFLGQANQGIFSHKARDGIQTIYAFDFSLDAKEEVLAARSGTVVDFYDWIPDNIDPDNTQIFAARAASDLIMGPGWRADALGRNSIVIRHDVMDPNHDRGPGGTPITTFAHYLHGRQNSIRDIFAARGIAPASIIGTVIQQGQPIMLAGDTGKSFYNHLHMDIRTGVQVSLVNFTIPFVFRDGGRLDTLTWLTSENVKVP